MKCPGGICAGTPPLTNAKFGKINGIAASQATILNQSFPLWRELFNVYSNGTNSNFPVSTDATLNYVSEAGFICKQDAVVDTSDSASTFGTIIRSVITASGFFPLPSGTMDATNVSSNVSFNVGDPKLSGLPCCRPTRRNYQLQHPGVLSGLHDRRQRRSLTDVLRSCVIRHHKHGVSGDQNRAGSRCYLSCEGLREIHRGRRLDTFLELSLDTSPGHRNDQSQTR